MTGYARYLSSLLEKSLNKPLANNTSLSHEKAETSDLTPLDTSNSDVQIESPVFHTAVEKQPKMIAQLDGSDERPDNLIESRCETFPQSQDNTHD